MRWMAAFMSAHSVLVRVWSLLLCSLSRWMIARSTVLSVALLSFAVSVIGVFRYRLIATLFALLHSLNRCYLHSFYFWLLFTVCVHWLWWNLPNLAINFARAGALPWYVLNKYAQMLNIHFASLWVIPMIIAVIMKSCFVALLYICFVL